MGEKTVNFYTDKITISFTPIEKESDKDKTKTKDEEIKEDSVIGKSRIIAIILALFLGRFGLHKFYLGKPALGFLYLLFSRFQIVFFLSICDAIIYIFMDQQTWLKEYGYKKITKKKED